MKPMDRIFTLFCYAHSLFQVVLFLPSFSLAVPLQSHGRHQEYRIQGDSAPFVQQRRGRRLPIKTGAVLMASLDPSDFDPPPPLSRTSKKSLVRLDRQSGANNNTLIMIRERRVKSILKGRQYGEKNISHWLATLDSNGKWPDSEVDYTTGCAARRANWPAQTHWQRILTMASAWHGALGRRKEHSQNETLRAAISLAVDYWFRRDFPGTACLDQGGSSACPCSNPNNYLWNTNWYSNVILIPGLVGQTCLLLGDTLSSVQLQNCIRMTSRSYEYDVNGLTGANTLDVSRIGMDQALLTGNNDLLADAYRRSHGDLVIADKVRADGIRADGSFGQHDGMLYNGNYGKDYANDILGIELEAAGTQYTANATGRAAFATQFEGNRWMIVRNTITGILHWDFSVLGRFISFPVADQQATGGIKIDLKVVGKLGREWNSHTLKVFERSLASRTSHANAGNLIGNRMFYTNDYMAHRGHKYVSTLKMWSTRTRDTECINSQNPLGFHLADGVSYTYVRGDEYEDIAAAWDWDLIPGITTDYGATPLTCSNTNLLGIETFVGGVSDGKVGISAMRYTNPLTKALHWQKAWFFLEDDVQHVMISDLSSTSADALVYSVLDQRRRHGQIIVDGWERESPVQVQVYPAAQSLWHGNVGYTFSDWGQLNVQAGPKTGNWSAIGISAQPPVTVNLFAAWMHHKKGEGQGEYPPVSYSVFPGTSFGSFVAKSALFRHRLETLRNDEHVSAVYDKKHEIFMAVFWDVDTGGTSDVTFMPDSGCAPIMVSVDGNAAVIYKLRPGLITVSDPSQRLETIKVTLSLGDGSRPETWRRPLKTKTLVFSLPGGGLAGSSVTLGM